MIAPMNRQFARQTTTSPGRRARSRLRVRLPVKVTSLSCTQTGVLADLSLNGARLCLSRTVAPGAEVLLQWAGFEAFGTVSWERDGMCGVRFAEPITPKVLVATRDIDDASQLPKDREIARAIASEWVMGQRKL